MPAAGEAVPGELREALEGAAVAIWTTTGWTIPANQAVAVNERLQYALVEAQARTALLKDQFAARAESSTHLARAG